MNIYVYIFTTNMYTYILFIHIMYFIGGLGWLKAEMCDVSSYGVAILHNHVTF